MLFALSLSLPSSSSSLFEKTTKTRLLRGGVLLLLLQKLSSRENERKEGRKEGRKTTKCRRRDTKNVAFFRDKNVPFFFLTKLNKTLNKGVKKVGKKCVHFLYYLD
jgi:hypothetical protein